MDSYSVKIKPSAEREIIKITQLERKRVVKKIISLGSKPRPVRCEKLEGEIYYRVRQGAYRIVYEINDNAKLVRIIKVGHRRDVYRRV